MALVCIKDGCKSRMNPIVGSIEKYCPACGTTLQTIPDPPPIQHATRWARFGGFFIDRILLIPFDFLSILPVAGPILVVCFWLFRDINGRSIGKAAVGTIVISKNGRSATSMQRIMRNLPFAVILLPTFIPIVGEGALFLQGLVVIIEAMAVVFAGERLGDKLANTMVVKKSTLPAIQRSMSSIEI